FVIRYSPSPQAEAPSPQLRQRPRPKLPATCCSSSQRPRHRVRVISNAILNWPTAPQWCHEIEVDSLKYHREYTPERFDFVLTADRPPGNYLLMVGPGPDCDSRFTMARQSRHRELRRYRHETPLQGAGNPAYSTCSARPGGPSAESVQRAPDANHIDLTPKFYLAFDFEVVNNSRYHHRPITHQRRQEVRRSLVHAARLTMSLLHMPPAPLLYQFDDVLQLGKNVSVAEVKRTRTAGLLPANLEDRWKGPGPDRRWQQRELRLAETHRLHMTALGLAAAGAVLLAALLSVFLTRRFGLRSNPVQNIETVSEAVSYGSLKAPSSHLLILNSNLEGFRQLRFY
uniref:Peptidase M12A domain-containing protein n=1 Tax=Macrostomum lignano TaxID=282301 RepID=A0A1I8FFH5_9PLAT